MAARETREDDVALIAEMLDCDRGTPTRRAAIIDRAFQRFGWAMFSDAAVEFMAERLDADQRYRDRCDARSRALAEEGRAERALIQAQRETGDLLPLIETSDEDHRSAA